MSLLSELCSEHTFPAVTSTPSKNDYVRILSTFSEGTRYHLNQNEDDDSDSRVINPSLDSDSNTIGMTMHSSQIMRETTF